MSPETGLWDGNLIGYTTFNSFILWQALRRVWRQVYFFSVGTQEVVLTCEGVGSLGSDIWANTLCMMGSVAIHTSPVSLSTLMLSGKVCSMKACQQHTSGYIYQLTHRSVIRDMIWKTVVLKIYKSKYKVSKDSKCSPWVKYCFRIIASAA